MPHDGLGSGGEVELHIFHAIHNRLTIIGSQTESAFF
jgi:hypothetical protein